MKWMKAVPVAVVALLLLSFVPAALGSTLTVTLNPNSKVAELTSVSTTEIVLAYPAGSSLSNYLNGYNSSQSLSGSFNRTSDAVQLYTNQFSDSDNDQVAIQNMTVNYQYNAKANATTLVVNKETQITAWVVNVFSVKNGSVVADLGWRSFYIRGALDLSLENHMVDVNLIGPTLTQTIASRVLGLQLVISMFEGSSLWNTASLNFSSLNSPLSSWTRSYNSLTNTTSYSKTVSGESTLSTSYTNDGKTYSLSVVSDPSAKIAAHGYAEASANSLTIVPTPLYLTPSLWAAIVATLAFLGGVGYMIARRTKRAGPPSPPTTLA